MIGLDTNVLARYYIEDKSDSQAQRQRLAARRLIESGAPLMVCKSVLLEFEWVMRGYYRFSSNEVLAVMRHLLTFEHIAIEERATFMQALSQADAGIDLADAMHHASCRACTSMASFDDRKFGQRAKKLGLMPSVLVPI